MSALALPNILLFLGWLQPYIAIPLSLGAAWLAAAAFRCNCGELVLDRTGRWKAAIVLVFVLICQFGVGYTGHTFQHVDFFQRNAMLGNLIDYAWPVILPDGREMVFYCAFWLPVAFLCKIAMRLGIDCSDLTGLPGWLLWMWNSALLYLVVLLVWLKLGRASLLWFLIFLGIWTLDAVLGRAPWGQGNVFFSYPLRGPPWGRKP